MDSTVEVVGSGRTSGALAKPSRDATPLRSGLATDRFTATEGREGEGAPPDEPATSAVAVESRRGSSGAVESRRGSSGANETQELVRASTRFEIRIRPRDDDGRDIPENLELLRALDEASEMVATARNVGMRACERRDADWLDGYLAERGEMPKKPEWPQPTAEAKAFATQTYHIMRQACARLNTGVVATLSKDVWSKWTGARYDVLIRQVEARPHCKPTHPIPIPSSNVKRLTRHEDGSVTASFRLYSTVVDGAGDVTIRLVPRDSRQRAELDAIASGAWKLGQVILSRHAEKRGRWFVRIAYTKRLPPSGDAGVVCARRGMRCLLVAAASDGDVRSIDGGTDIVEFKRRMHARRRSFGERGRGAGAVGHGVRRSIAPLIKLSNAEGRYSRTRCQQAAKRLVDYALVHKANRVVLEDFSTPRREDDWWIVKQWPWFMLKAACKSACEGVGLRFDEVFVAGKLRRCPSCKHEHIEKPVDSFGTWECAACGMKRSSDQVTALNMLVDVGAEEGVSRAEGARGLALRGIASAKATSEPPVALDVGKVAGRKEKAKADPPKVGSGGTKGRSARKPGRK